MPFGGFSSRIRTKLGCSRGGCWLCPAPSLAHARRRREKKKRKKNKTGRTGRTGRCATTTLSAKSTCTGRQRGSRVWTTFGSPLFFFRRIGNGQYHFVLARKLEKTVSSPFCVPSLGYTSLHPSIIHSPRSCHLHNGHISNHPQRFSSTVASSCRSRTACLVI